MSGTNPTETRPQGSVIAHEPPESPAETSLPLGAPGPNNTSFLSSTPVTRTGS